MAVNSASWPIWSQSPLDLPSSPGMGQAYNRRRQKIDHLIFWITPYQQGSELPEMRKVAH